MENLLKIYQHLSNSNQELIYKEGLFIFDAQVLLNLLRQNKKSREGWLKTLQNEKIKTRVWVPFQVLFEFIVNFEEVLGNDSSNFSNLKKIFEEEVKDLSQKQTIIKNKIESLKLKDRHTVLNAEDFIPGDFWDEPIKRMNESLDKLESFRDIQITKEEGIEIKNAVLEIFNGRVGDCFSKDELEAIYLEGLERYKQQIPPGYLDINKVDKNTGEDLFRRFEDKIIVGKFGDLINWKEIIKKAKTDGVEYILWVTDDQKSDWYIRQGKEVIGPRIELLNEIYFNASSLKIFQMASSAEFLRYVGKILQIEVEESSIKESEISITDPIDYGLLKKVPFVSEVIKQALYSVSPELELHFQDTSLHTIKSNLTAYTDFGTTPFYPLYPEKFSAAIATVFRFLQSISSGNTIYYKFEVCGTPFYRFEFSVYYKDEITSFNPDLLRLEVNSIYPDIYSDTRFPQPALTSEVYTAKIFYVGLVLRFSEFRVEK